LREKAGHEEMEVLWELGGFETNDKKKLKKGTEIAQSA
jgi:hypothetical protein